MDKQVKARVIKASTSTTTNQIYEDDFSGFYGDIIEPPYNLTELKLIGEYSSILQQCVDAYKTNIIEFGIEAEYKIDINSDDVPKEVKEQAESELERLDEFMRYLSLDESAEDVLGFVIDDKEKTGNGYLEIIRNGKGLPVGIEYADAQHIRVCKKTVEKEVAYTILEGGVEKSVTRWKKFRRYVQIIDGNKVFFKEYGDPRIMNLTNGTFNNSTPDKLRASEIYHFKIGSETYGKPRWLGNLISLYGARKAEELNFTYFKNGRHIPAAITVTNGKLDDESFEALQGYMDGLEGSDNAHKFLLIEAEGSVVEDSMGKEKVTPVKVEIKSLAEIMQKDALFLEYDESTRRKIRSSFRLPSLYTGETEDFSKATAETARKVAEEQVFQPERKRLGRTLNSLFLEPLGLKYVRIGIKGADFRDPVEIGKALYPSIAAGAVAPNDLRQLLGDILGKKIEPFAEEYNVPLQVIMQRMGGSSALSSAIAMEKSDGEDAEFINLMKDIRDVLDDLS